MRDPGNKVGVVFVMCLRYSLITEEKQWVILKTSSNSFPFFILANRFSTTKVVNRFRSRLLSKSAEISSSVEQMSVEVSVLST